MYRVLAPTCVSQLRTTLAVISGPLSERMCSGMPRMSMASAMVSMHTEAVDPPRNPDGQAFAGELVDQRHQPDLAAIMGLGLDEVVGPDMIAPLRSQPDAGAVVEPQTASWPLFLGYFQPLTAPDALHTVLAHIPPGLVEQCRDPAIAIATILGGQGDDGPRQRIFISSNNGRVTLRSARLADEPAGMAFRETVLLPNAARPPAGAVRGLQVSRGDILENLLLKRQIRHQPLQPGVLLLQILHPPRLIKLKPAVFLAPAVIALLARSRPPGTPAGADLPCAISTSICRSSVS